MGLSGINIPAVLLASFIDLSIVTVWFSPALFGAVWTRDLGRPEEEMWAPFGPRGLAVISIALLVFNAGVELAADHTGVVGMSGGVTLGLGIWSFLVLPLFIVLHTAERRSWRLAAVHSGLFMVIAVISSALFAMWRF